MPRVCDDDDVDDDSRVKQNKTKKIRIAIHENKKRIN